MKREELKDILQNSYSQEKWIKSLQFLSGSKNLLTISLEPKFVEIKSAKAKEIVVEVIVGEPKQMDGSPSQSAEIINAFVANFVKAFPQMPLARVDERFTSKIASRAILDSGAKKKQRRDKALVDTVSAVIILQSYMN